MWQCVCANNNAMNCSGGINQSKLNLVLWFETLPQENFTFCNICSSNGTAPNIKFNKCDSRENQTNINQREINLHTLLSPISRRQQLEDQPSLYCITQVYLICKYLQIFVICHSAMLQILAINNFFSTSNTFG